MIGDGMEVTGHMREDWMDDEAVPASWLHFSDDDPNQCGDDPRLCPAADEDPLLPDDEPPQPDEEPWWLTDEVCGTPEEEHAAWLASLPADIRAQYQQGPEEYQQGPEEYLEGREDRAAAEFAPGFTHHDDGGAAGAGFAARGVLDQLVPGPLLARALAEATRLGHDELNDSEQIGVLCGWQRQAAWAQAGLAATAAAVARRRDAQAAAARNPHLSEHVRDEIAVALTLTPLSAGRLLTQGTGLHRLPEVAAALAAGQIDWPKACIFVDELVVLDGQLAQGIAAQLLSAGRLTTSQLRARLRRAVLAADPDAARRRQRDGRADTRVEVWDEPSGNGVLSGRELRPADVIVADARLTADASWLRGQGTPGTLAELRATAFIARLSGRELATLLPEPIDSAAPAAPSGTINLTLPLSAYAGLDDSPGEAAGYGAIDAGTGRQLAQLIAGNPAARWCLTLTGPDGRAAAHACAHPGHAPEPGAPAIRWAAGLHRRLQFLRAGSCTHARQTAGYAWPAALRHLIETRQRTCAAPGCRRDARRCDIDHTTPYEKGGRTCECNGAPLCRRHHRAKQAPGWRLTQDQPGVMTWQLPSGRTYTTTGEPYRHSLGDRFIDGSGIAARTGIVDVPLGANLDAGS